MNAKLPMLLVFLAAAGCATPPPAVREARPSAPLAAAKAPAPGPEPEAAPLPPAEALSQADLAYESQLGAARGQFSADRQVAVLRQAIFLYGQFLERAEGRPELEPAVRKSHERMEDAQATIDFLLNQSNPDSGPRHPELE
jgi:hypothetical protein